jgi:hypothetical protein
MNGQRVDAVRKLTRQRLIDHAMACEPALSCKSFRHYMNPEMGLSVPAMGCVAFMEMGFIDHVERARPEGFCQFFDNSVSRCHWVLPLRIGSPLFPWLVRRI